MMASRRCLPVVFFFLQPRRRSTDASGDITLDESRKPKPSFALVGLSVVILAVCILLISLAISAFFVSWDPCSLVGGVILLFLPAALAVQQYRGTFRHSTGAAFAAGVSLFVVGGLAFVAFATTLGELIVEGVRIPWIPLLLPMVATAIIGCLAAWLNLRWSRRLKLTTSSPVNAPVHARFSLGELLFAMATIAGVTALSSYFVRTTLPQYAEDVSRDRAPSGLPASAQHISFCQGVRGTIAYEFTIDEEDFVAWVESGIGSLESDAANVPVQPIIGTYTIDRYYALTADLTGPDSIAITNGLYYSWSKEDRGVYAAFDRTTGRAYYYAHQY